MTELMKSKTHREYRTWQRWLREQWNTPNRTDHYILRVAQRVQQVLRKDPNKVTVEDQLVKFTFDEAKKPSRKESVDQAKRRWKTWIGLRG